MATKPLILRSRPFPRGPAWPDGKGPNRVQNLIVDSYVVRKARLRQDRSYRTWDDVSYVTR